MLRRQSSSTAGSSAGRYRRISAPGNWYRNFTRNWHTLEPIPQHVACPALMIHGRYDIVQASDRLKQFVPNVEIHTLECGHWIQQEKPAETNRLMLEWLGLEPLRLLGISRFADGAQGKEILTFLRQAAHEVKHAIVAEKVRRLEGGGLEALPEGVAVLERHAQQIARAAQQTPARNVPQEHQT